jgi:hypothetical protein
MKDLVAWAFVHWIFAATRRSEMKRLSLALVHKQYL